jgi:hypothetical protein
MMHGTFNTKIKALYISGWAFSPNQLLNSGHCSSLIANSAFINRMSVCNRIAGVDYSGPGYDSAQMG